MTPWPKIGTTALLGIALGLPVATCRAAGPVPEQSRGTLQLAANSHLVQAEVAATLASRARGLMFREALPENRGMLFVSPEKLEHCMWMKNTRIPLSAAFLESDGTIVNIVDMEPGTTEDHCASRPVRHVLEMNRGWFRAMGVGVGDRISGLEKAPEGR